MTELTDYLTDRYQVLDTFSENERARVELVRDKNTGLVAVKKTVHRADTVYPQLRDRHFAGTPMVYDLYQCAGETVVLEEYVPGETMARCAEGRRRLGVAQVGRWLCALCDILEPLHRAGLVHRDIKPQNVLVRPDGQLFLIDFEAARQYDPRQKNDTVYLGTKGYAAPEQYGYAQTDARTDLYALGALANWLLCGKLPEERRWKGPLAGVIDCCLRIDPAQRYQSATQLRGAVQQALAGLSAEEGGVFPAGAVPSAAVSLQQDRAAVAAALPATAFVPSDPVGEGPPRRWQSVFGRENAWRLVTFLAFAAFVLWAALTSRPFESAGAAVVSCLIYLWIFLPHAAYWLDLGRVRTRPPFRALDRRGQRWLAGLCYLAVWLVVLLVLVQVGHTLYRVP